MSEPPSFTLYLATARDDKGTYHPRAFFVFQLIGSDGEVRAKGETAPAAPLPGREVDPNYSGFLACLPHLPDGCHVRIVSAEAHLYGSLAYPGIFNTSPAERALRAYTRRNPKDGLLANHEQLQAIDAELMARGITTSAERSTLLEDEMHHQPIREWARRLLKANPSASPGDWWL